MERGLGGANGQNHQNGDMHSGANTQGQRSPAPLEQGAEGEGFILCADLSLMLGLAPGAMLSRSMFYGSMMAPVVLDLLTQILEVQRSLLLNQPIEGTDNAQAAYDYDSLMASNASLVDALIDSLEAPEGMERSEEEEFIIASQSEE